MTLIVVDHERMTADNYATVNSVHEVKVLDGFPKLFALPFRVSINGLMCYPRLAFSGDAHAFYAFFLWLNELAKGFEEVDISWIRDTVEFKKSKLFMIILPFPGGAVSIQYGVGAKPQMDIHEGKVLGFGGDYISKTMKGVEYRNWEAIFCDSIVGGWLPRGGYHYLTHSMELVPSNPVPGELTVPSSTPGEVVQSPFLQNHAT